MGKKDSKPSKEAKKARMAEKSAKALSKSERKNKKMASKTNEAAEVDDIDEMLNEFARKQAEFEKVTSTLIQKPQKCQNTALVSNPVAGKHEIFMFGGESVLNGSSTFHNDLYVFSLGSKTWTKVTSPNSPMPRSGHAMCPHPSGIILLFGGEFSSPKQTTFYHYGDTWVLDPVNRDWIKVEHRVSPSSRSGHRMCVWKNYILLHGGFRDLAASTTYLDDLWAFDVRSYKWEKIEFPPTAVIPDRRSGHTLIPSEEGAILWGGYSKIKAKKGHQTGKVHQDYWLLKMKSDFKAVRWERRKKAGFAPSPRIGCYMVPHKGRGVLFGGVYDTSETEDSLQSTFYNSLYAYNVENNRWFLLKLCTPRKAPVEQLSRSRRGEKNIELEENLSRILKDMDIDADEILELGTNTEELVDEGKDTFSVVNQLPHVRFGASLCVCGDLLFIYGGVYEEGESEYTFDSFYSLNLSKLDGVTVYWEDLGLHEKPYDSESDRESADSEDESGDNTDAEELEENQLDENVDTELDDESDVYEEDQDPRPWLPHPKPFEILSRFYSDNINVFVEWALKIEPEARGKDLKRVAFNLCEGRWWERRESLRAAEEQLDEMAGSVDVVERTSARSSRR